MSWQPVNFQLPPSLAAVRGNVSAVIGAGDGELSSADIRLSAVPVVSGLTVNPVSTQAAQAVTARQSLVNLLAFDGKLLVVHPWQHTVGQGEGNVRALSAINAIARLADKLTDQQDRNTPTGAMEAVAILVATASAKDLSSNLSALNAVFPVPELQFVQRRAEQLRDLEKTKWIQRTAPLSPFWKRRQLQQFPALSDSGRYLNQIVATADGYDTENTTPSAELSALIAKKKSYLQQLDSDYTTLQNQLSGSAGLALYVTGSTPATLAQALKTAASPGHESTLSTAILFTGQQGQLTALKEIVGL